MERKNYTINATDKVLGRLATKIANLLRGKNKPNFVPYLDMGDFVTIKNAKGIRVTGKKAEQKIYRHHSGYLGGLKEVPYRKIFETDPNEIIRKAVHGMLPKNKLAALQIRRLKFEK